MLFEPYIRSHSFSSVLVLSSRLIGKKLLNLVVKLVFPTSVFRVGISF